MISAKIIADSISNDGARITSVELEYPRFIHTQFMTHRMFSRSASSSRAIPIKKLIEAVDTTPVMPSVWGKNQRGMQANEVFDKESIPALDAAWLSARDAAIYHANRLASFGVHKQIVNRILEPFSHIHVIVTATEWENFFSLRRHDSAQPEIQELANKIWDAMNASTPTRTDGWHLPYIMPDERTQWPDDACIMYSVARCARVSYVNHGMLKVDYEQDAKLHNMLRREGHMSPFEHQARPRKLEDPPYTSNFNGWIQYRKTLPNEAVYRRT